MNDDVDLDLLFKRLHLANARRVWRDMIQRAEKESWSYRDLLAVLVAEEIAQRQQTRLARLSRHAGFPFLKTVDDFDFTYQSTLRLALLGSALSPDFVTEGRCLILRGKPGRGKTHLAVAIAYRAIQNGFDALFTTAAELIDELSAEFRQGRLAQSVARYTNPNVLVVDEVGYLTYGTDAANMLFHVVNDRHRRKRSMIFTTNKSLGAWGQVLHDEDLAQAIVDRVLERGRVITLDGPSLRTMHLGLDDPTQADALTELARISGIPRPEFPEPTTRGISWIKAARQAFEEFPEDAQRVCLRALTVAAEGGKSDIAKPLRGLGSGVFEVALPFRGDAFRVVYAVQLADEIWVVHAFQKKSTQGIKTPVRDIGLVKDRLKSVREMLR